MACDNKQISNSIREYAGKLKAEDIAAKTGIHITTVFKYAKKIGVSLQTKASIQQREKLKKFIEKNHSKMSAEQIANYMNMKPGTVRHNAVKMGFELKGFRVKVIKPKSHKYFNERKHENWLI